MRVGDDMIMLIQMTAMLRNRKILKKTTIPMALSRKERIKLAESPKVRFQALMKVTR